MRREEAQAYWVSRATTIWAQDSQVNTTLPSSLRLALSRPNSNSLFNSSSSSYKCSSNSNSSSNTWVTKAACPHHCPYLHTCRTLRYFFQVIITTPVYNLILHFITNPFMRRNTKATRFLWRRPQPATTRVSSVEETTASSIRSRHLNLRELRRARGQLRAPRTQMWWLNCITRVAASLMDRPQSFWKNRALRRA